MIVLAYAADVSANADISSKLTKRVQPAAVKEDTLYVI